LIDKDEKIPVFAEFDQEATVIWKDFLDYRNLRRAEKKVSRNEILQIRNRMEQYMIGISDKDAAISGLEKYDNGIYKIDRGSIGTIYDETIRFMKR
jgi:hypothetical protein